MSAGQGQEQGLPVTETSAARAGFWGFGGVCIWAGVWLRPVPALVLSCIWSSFSLVVCSSGHLCQPARVTQLEFSALSPKCVPSAHLPPRGFISARCPLPGPSPWRSLLSRQLLAPGLTPRPTWRTASTTASERPTALCSRWLARSVFSPQNFCSVSLTFPPCPGLSPLTVPDVRASSALVTYPWHFPAGPIARRLVPTASCVYLLYCT